MESSTLFNEMNQPLLEEVETPTALEESMEDEQGSAKSNARHEFLMRMLLSFLLLTQFSMSYSSHQDGTQEVSFGITCCGIAVFLLTAWLYHTIIRDLNYSSMVLLLLPELAVNVCLLLILWGEFSVAFMCLLTASLAFSAAVVLVSLRSVCSHKDDDEQQDEDVVETNALTLCQTV